MSVISAALAVVLAIGFPAVMVGAAVAYAITWGRCICCGAGTGGVSMCRTAIWLTMLNLIFIKLAGKQT
jgi:hypothetical protein